MTMVGHFFVGDSRGSEHVAPDEGRRFRIEAHSSEENSRPGSVVWFLALISFGETKGSTGGEDEQLTL